MSLICGLSNEVPETPVVSPVSGSIFEKRLIVKYINEHGNDPINGSDLTEDMLIEIKGPSIVKPKTPSATSVPAILKTLQDEWDATVLHAFTLRKQLQAARQELSHVLYQHDAACRVIARLTKEVTAAREALATLKPKTDPNISIQSVSNNSFNNGDHSMEELRPEVGITPDILEKLDSKAAVLTAERKRRGKSVPEGLVDIDTIREMKTVASHTGLHSASTAGIVSFDICPLDDSKFLTGGNDKVAIVFDKNAGQVVTTLKGHTKKVTSVIYHPNQTTAITASPDASIRVWNLANSNTTHVVSAHEGPITAISLHATGDYLLSTSTDEFWAFSDLNAGVMLCRVGDPSSAHALTTAKFHPDGLIFGTGTTDSVMKIWDLKEKSNVANFPGHTGSISAMAFSENGYYLATAAEDSTVKLWDLRKLKNFKTIVLQDNYQVKDLYFDNSGTYLAVAGTDVRIYHTKQWDNLITFEDHTGLATGVRFGDNAKFLVSTSLDRSLKIYSSS
ncbi:pre-mRNA-processing factor 19-like [Panonychus citri]|uniref:pre-mRNA-processing factor 19-like n=1 Tax=Panonychus citri TaxID=50023 RepID=UPI0023078048|nr:pre-mRNA-processing factor 19-like [Panonychus citri]